MHEGGRVPDANNRDKAYKVFSRKLREKRVYIVVHRPDFLESSIKAIPPVYTRERSERTLSRNYYI